MTMKEQVIQMCKDLRLPSIRKLVTEEAAFTNPEQAIKILHQVLAQEKDDRFIRAKQNRIRAAKDRKSTRLNSSHVATSYAVSCLQKKTRHHAGQSTTIP